MPATADPARLEVAPYDFEAALALERELGVSHTLAQVLVRRGLDRPEQAAAFLQAGETHPLDAFGGIAAAAALIVEHVRRGTPIAVHGDYDVDGVCSTAILVRCLRRLGADPSWFLPSRLEDGYGLSAATVERLAARDVRLLITADCGITAVEEVKAARAAGMDVVVSDHHQPRSDGLLPDAAIVHPLLGGYPCPELCAAGVALKLAQAVEREAGTAPVAEEQDSDLVCLATVADCVPLRGENRRLVRDGLPALAATAKPGLRALMAVSQVDRERLDERAISFRLAPRINAAGRLQRADAGLELVLTADEGRARAVAGELHALNAQRRDTETRILFAAEAQVAERPGRAGYVLAGDDWHPGVIGIVASRLVERHHRPMVLVALDGDAGTASGRSIEGFDLLAALDSCQAHLERYGGHRAAAGAEVRRDCLAQFGAAFERHAETALGPDELTKRERVDCVVGGDALTLGLAEELDALAPFGIANPPVSVLVPASAFGQPTAMGEGRHVRFAVHGGGAHARAVAFGVSAASLPVEPGEPADATFTLEVNSFRGMVEPRLVLRTARPSSPDPVEVVGEPGGFWEGVEAELDAELGALAEAAHPGPRRKEIDRRGRGLAGTIGDLVACGAPPLVVCAGVAARLRGLAGRLGGFTLCSWSGLERDPALAEGFEHLVVLDPPSSARAAALAVSASGREGLFTHLAWGEPELRFSQQIIEQEYGVRAPLAALYRALRDRGGANGEELEDLLRADAQRPRSPALAGRLLRVLVELDLVSLGRDRRAVSLRPEQPTALERSPAFREYEQRREDAQRFLTAPRARAA